MKSKVYYVCLTITFLFSNNIYSQKVNDWNGNISPFLEKFYSIDLKGKPEINSNVDYLNIFFLDGNCSHCITEMVETESFFETVNSKIVASVFIVDTNDTMYFNFFKDKFEIQSDILWDKDNYMNEIFNDLSSRELFLFNAKGEVLVRGDFINSNNLRKKYFRILNSDIKKN